MAFLPAVRLPGQKNVHCASFSAGGNLLSVSVPFVTGGAHFQSGLLVLGVVHTCMEPQKAAAQTVW